MNKLVFGKILHNLTKEICSTVTYIYTLAVFTYLKAELITRMASGVSRIFSRGAIGGHWRMQEFKKGGFQDCGRRPPLR